jgi:hypothetical protein
MLTKEIAALKKIFESEAIKLLQNPKYLPHGNPLEEGPSSRYAAWPARGKEMPLLFFSSKIVLGANSAANDSVERLNSSAGYIFSKLRNTLTPASVEQLTLARAHLQAVAKEEAMGKSFEELDLADLIAAEEAAKAEQAEAEAAVAEAAEEAAGAAEEDFEEED